CVGSRSSSSSERSRGLATPLTKGAAIDNSVSARPSASLFLRGAGSNRSSDSMASELLLPLGDTLIPTHSVGCGPYLLPRFRGPPCRTDLLRSGLSRRWWLPGGALGAGRSGRAVGGQLGRSVAGGTSCTLRGRGRSRG